MALYLTPRVMARNSHHVARLVLSIARLGILPLLVAAVALTAVASAAGAQPPTIFLPQPSGYYPGPPQSVLGRMLPAGTRRERRRVKQPASWCAEQRAIAAIETAMSIRLGAMQPIRGGASLPLWTPAVVHLQKRGAARRVGLATSDAQVLPYRDRRFTPMALRSLPPGRSRSRGIKVPLLCKAQRSSS